MMKIINVIMLMIITIVAMTLNVLYTPTTLRIIIGIAIGWSVGWLLPTVMKDA